MRIVAGEFKGRRLRAPEGRATRPTTDRVREALFSALCSLLGPDLGEASVLDPFAGSGALGLEALSRGASSATFVDNDRRALTALKANVAELGAGARSTILAGEALAVARRQSLPGAPFSLLLLDPPYRIDATEVARLLETLSKSGLVAEGALVTWEHAAGESMPWPDGFKQRSRKKYGSTEIDVAEYERWRDA